MPSGAPPPYEAATANANPNVAVTTPAGNTRSASTDQALNQAAGNDNLERSRTNETVSSNGSDDNGYGEGLIGEEGRRSMDDERRDLPEGWVRCFDPKTEHHFYVDEKTKRSSWLHPYDDPEFLRTLPESHPANPKSKQAQDIRKRAEDEELLMKKYQDRKGGKLDASTAPASKGVVGPSSGAGGEERNWFQKKKDKLIGTKEERAQAKEAKRKAREEERRKMRLAEEAYLKRRKELMEQRLNDPAIQRYYASDPYGYAAPSMAFSRGGGLYGSPYGYGYGGGYGRRYGGGGMGMGLPLFGGLAGGMLLGSAMTGGFDGGYGYGGGDFGGGGFGGGGFDGGGGGGFDGGGGGGF